jgi:hypothetical protein
MVQLTEIVGVIVVIIGLGLILGGLLAFHDDIIGWVKGWAFVAAGIPVLGWGARILMKK